MNLISHIEEEWHKTTASDGGGLDGRWGAGLALVYLFIKSNMAKKVKLGWFLVVIK